MKLLPQEKIVKVYHHHPLFFVWRSIKVWSASVPFLLMIYWFSSVLSFSFVGTAIISVFIVFGLINLYDFLMYYLDTLVLTNYRIVHLDWINLFRYFETEAGLHDIQDIETEENGFLSKWKWFDFGIITIETASTRSILQFVEAPDPEAIKFYVTNLARNHAELTGLNRPVANSLAYKLTQNHENQVSKVVR